MELRLIATQTILKEDPRLKPVDHFQKCPACGCKELIHVSPDVVCSHCDWDSTAWDVSRGGMDNVFTAAHEFGIPVMETAPINDESGLPPNEANQPELNVEGA